MMAFKPSYGWLVHVVSLMYCLTTLAIFGVVWIPAGLLLELPMRLFLQDTMFARPESFLTKKPGFIRALGTKLFSDNRDWFKIYYTLYLMLVLVPAAVYMIMYCTPEKCLFQAGIYYVLLYGPRVKLFPRFFGAFHYEAHHSWSKKSSSTNDMFNRHFEYVYGTLAGCIPELSGTCHVKLHHAQHGSHDDTESLLAFNRLNALDYVFKFLPDQLTSHALNLDGFRYFFERKNWTCLSRLLYGTLFYACFAAVVFYLNPLAAIFVVAVPLSVFNMIISIATWTTHAFLYKEDLIRSATTLVDEDTYAEGMHLSHQ